MSRVAVDGAGYTEASALLHDANLWGAYCFDRLGDALAQGGAMAGDSSLAAGFSQQYDAATRAALTTFADVITALGNLGRVAFVSWENHSRAELASTYGAIRLVDDVGLGTPDWVEVLPTCPPSSLGGDLSSLPGWANTILDHVEGFVWPDADVDRLRATAAAWRSAGDGLEDVATYPGRAIDAMLGELSPEILPATAVLGRLKLAASDLAGHCRDIATQCDGYAQTVEEQREAILDLVRDLLVEAAVIQAAGFVLGAFTFGIANGGAAAINLAKIAAKAPRFKRCLDIVRRFADDAADALRGTQLALAGIGTRVGPMTNTRLLMTAETTQAGAAGGSATKRVLTFLERHEGGPMGAHTLERHVGKTDDYLRERMLREGKKEVSTFTDIETADRSLNTVFDLRRNKIDGFMSSHKQTTAFEAPVSNAGRVMLQDGSVVPGTSVRVQLAKDASMPEGYRIITAFLQP